MCTLYPQRLLACGQVAPARLEIIGGGVGQLGDLVLVQLETFAEIAF